MRPRSVTGADAPLFHAQRAMTDPGGSKITRKSGLLSPGPALSALPVRPSQRCAAVNPDPRRANFLTETTTETSLDEI